MLQQAHKPDGDNWRVGKQERKHKTAQHFSARASESVRNKKKTVWECNRFAFTLLLSPTFAGHSYYLA